MQVKKRLDYQPPTFSIDNVNLDFDLAPDATHVMAQLTISRIDPNASDDLVLDGHDLTLVSILLDGVILDKSLYDLSDNHLIIRCLPAHSTLTVVTKIEPQSNTALEGLYFASDTFCTQCEAEGFRRITYYLDRPDVLSIFTVTITADKNAYPFLLSNGNAIDSGDLPNGRHFVTWHDPFKKPAYLFALVAGDFDVLEDVYVTSSKRNVSLQVFVEKGRLDQANHAMQSLKKSMKWDEQTFNLEYDLDIYMIVAVDFFNMGAMENKGLNVFNSKFVLAQPASATDEDFFNIESIIAHEYFHNWTGNRVTCRDWFQLSLKEGLTVYRDQCFSHDMTSALSNRIKQVNVMRSHQFAEDASAMSHPIRPDEVIEMNNFYTVTVYDKGAEVIRMMHTLLGDKGFKAGMSLYFERHDGQAVTCDDFVDAMQDANSYDLSLFSRWYSQSGTPVVTVERSYDNEKRLLTLQLVQHTPTTSAQPEKHPLVLPIKYECLGLDGSFILANEDQGNSVVVMSTESASITFSNVDETSIVTLFNGFSAPVKVSQHFTPAQRLQIIKLSQDDFVKWEAMQGLFIQAAQHLTDHQVTLSDQSLVNLVLHDFLQLHTLHDWMNENMSKPELLAELLSLPSTDSLLQALPQRDILQLHKTKKAITLYLLHEFETLFLDKYLALIHSTPVYAYEQHQVNNRRLTGVLLELLAHLPQHQHLTKSHFTDSNNMTDTLSSLKSGQLANDDNFNFMMDKFSQDWGHDTVVMDKWFSLHATVERDDILSKLTLLQAHPKFSIENPNKVRALIGSFAFFNVCGFHATDGSGYEYLTNYLIKLDSVNAQVAARIITPLIQWQLHVPERQTLMVKQLRRLLDHRGLSKDLFEKVSKSVLQFEE